MKKNNYEAAGVSINTANEAKEQFKSIVSNDSMKHCTPINKVGAFASLVDIDLSGYKNPIFVLKSEEPGSKQLLSIDNNRPDLIARDLINHLVNDILVMGAKPCAVLDTIICGKFQKETILELVKGISDACRENGCILVGGETSEQPGVLPVGKYVLQASILGIVDKDKIIDGSAIKQGDVIVAVSSNGLHTNGYSLVRKLMDEFSSLTDEKVNNERFIDALLKPHRSYMKPIKLITDKYASGIHGFAHITGGGIHDNLIRIIGDDMLKAEIDLSKIKVPAIFPVIRNYADISDADMLSAFNMGVGLIAAVDSGIAGDVINDLNGIGFESYQIGEMEKSELGKQVVFKNGLRWEQ
jgi:phosphoribosylformylglycinamidine cyclo-ligase